ncbi:hypothetical protein TWF481_006781 [Arthrobotrys musiformis]|uniref:Uncharacterized protein n=1 Tax=Arthrobotrys musiformis TaxID=47236 RepID=A0AAV9WAI4_9PEZI
MRNFDALNKDISEKIYNYNGPSSNVTKMSADSVGRFSSLYQSLADTQCQFFNQLAAVPSRIGLNTRSELSGYHALVSWIHSRVYARLADTFTLSVSGNSLLPPMLNLNNGQENFSNCTSNTILQWTGTWA